MGRVCDRRLREQGCAGSPLEILAPFGISYHPGGGLSGSKQPSAGMSTEQLDITHVTSKCVDPPMSAHVHHLEDGSAPAGR
jgi:hypothetical protein